MFGKTKKTASRIASLILSAALFIPTMYGMTVKDFVRADRITKNRTNTKFGVETISDPRIPTSGDDPWQGSYVYFGNYQGEGLKFRVLNRTPSIMATGRCFSIVTLSCGMNMLRRHSRLQTGFPVVSESI